MLSILAVSHAHLPRFNLLDAAEVYPRFPRITGRWRTAHHLLSVATPVGGTQRPTGRCSSSAMASEPMDEYDRYLEVALAAAKEAGALIAAAWNKTKAVDTKAGKLL